jgi:hypothetical protein
MGETPRTRTVLSADSTYLFRPDVAPAPAGRFKVVSLPLTDVRFCSPNAGAFILLGSGKAINALF